MSVLSVAPELVSAAVGDLSGIGSAISEANLVAAAPTLGVVAPAADSVSAELAALFGTHAQTYRAVSSQADVFHQKFVATLSHSSTAYSQAEVESASALGEGHPGEGLRVLGSRQHQAAEGMGSRLWQPSRATLWRPGMSDPRLITPRHSLPAGSRLWHPGLPGFKTHNVFAPRLFTPHNQLLGGVLNGSRGIVQNIGGVIEQIIQNQISYLKLIGTSLVDFVKDEISAIENLPAFFKQIVGFVEEDNIPAAFRSAARMFESLFVNGPNWTGTLGHFAGPLADLMQIVRIPGQELQNLADLLKPLGLGYAGKFVQHIADTFNMWTDWTITDNGGSGVWLGLPLQITLDVLGPEIMAYRAFASQMQLVYNALVGGHPLGALMDIVKTPAAMTKGFLFGDGYLASPFGRTWVYAGYRGQLHVGGLFDPLAGQGSAYGFYATTGTLTGGLIPALVSLLPQRLQDPFHDLRRFLDGIAAKLMGLAALNY